MNRFAAPIILSFLAMQAPVAISAARADDCPSATGAEAMPGRLAIVRFEAARARGDPTAIEAAAAEVVRTFGAANLQLPLNVLSYFLFDRGQCDLGAYGMSLAASFPALAEGRLVCEAAALAPDDDAGSRHLLAVLLDSRVQSGAWRSDVFDQFARQATLNSRALAWLARHGLDDHRFSGSDESALIAQIRAGRATNVEALLGLRYDANAGTTRLHHSQAEVAAAAATVIPLQAARESLAAQGPRALEVARVLLAHGADPNKLRWFPPRADAAPVDPAVHQAFDMMLEAVAATREPVAAEFLGLRLDWENGGQRVFLRIQVRNGATAPLRLPGKRSGEDFVLGERASLQWRVPGGTVWDEHNVLDTIESAPERLVVPAGAMREVLFALDDLSPLFGSFRLERRLSFHDADYLWHRSDPFVLQGAATAIDHRP